MRTVAAICVALAIGAIALPRSVTARQTTPPSPPPAQQPPAQQPAAQQSAPAPSRFTFGDASNLVRMLGPEADFLLTAAALGDAADKLAGDALDKYAATLTVSDGGRLGGVSTNVVTVDTPRFVGRSGATGFAWLVKVHAAKLPSEMTERRLLTFAIGSGETRSRYGLEYTLTNVPATSGQYEVTVPGHDWIVSWSASDEERTLPLLIANKSEPLTDLRILQTSMKRSDDGESLNFWQFQLLQSANGQPAVNGQPVRIDLRANETKTVFLRLDQSKRIGQFGTYTGQILLGSQGTQPKTVALTTKVTSDGVKIVGVLLIVLGLLISLVTTNFLQPRLLRLQALRPALLLRDLVQQFSDRARAAAGTDVSGITAEADLLVARLQPDALDAAGLLPLGLNVSGGLPAESTTKFQALLNEISGKLAGLMVLRDGVNELRQRAAGRNRPQKLIDAITDLNEFAPKAVTADAAHAAVAAALALAIEKDDVEREEGFESFQRMDLPSTLTPVTVQQLDFVLHQTINVAAYIWASVSLAIGVTYVYSDVDFGTWYDLLGAFLWGLGLTTFGASLQQLTPRSVATQIGLNVPKSGTTA